MTHLVRIAVEDDLQGILDIYNDAILNTTAVYNYKPHTMEMRKKWFDEKVNSGIPVFVAVINNEVAGFASWGPFRAWAAYKYTVEHSVYVSPAYRRQGIAKALLQQLIGAAGKKEVHAIVAGIDAENEASIPLHLQLGFTEVGHFKEVGYKFGRWLDLKFFQLILQNGLQPEEDR